ncbi:DUF2891 domain-containing protein [Pluralibacter gergoviae]|uniref:DUF2891 domain-containing protein n=1 Tax=Pluralibacter gergoviae TaxID=61647 RepID=UPI0006511A6D|nr:DUF2891 domain-containing protein [Pluralibacter gergoviae]EKV0932233.1 DUF2891 domain-containing protein [Pluralibacter gergoviae]EKW6620684.1 DUF2891 domain-containing protein [Pluralibacter gergoviae]ELC3076657.1 DUF2891 domain-containing protein [Pluralibacter gergoviae]ELD4273488.1 DUF2891 domain-containing protein [Pluralibacter gergoviae]ELD4279164.1 DUF2891 domain-containing protein [Pluralibacter gergoviae]
MQLTQHQADAFARMPLTYLRQEYPNHIMHLLNSDDDVLPPRALHPIFYGCFDWHSAVHGYWLLLRCLRLYPTLSCRDEIVTLFNDHLTEENVAQELAYFNAPFRASFERPYGYGWLLALAQELKQSSLPQAGGWYQTLQPLTQDIRRRLMDYLSKLTYPIRVGTHYNTAFALALALDYARAVEDAALEQAIRAASARFYLADTHYPAHYEPGGDEYISGALTEALLMSKVVDDFPAWFGRFLPEVGSVTALMNPAQVSDRTDPKIAHLDGLNLSRAWCMKHIASALPKDHAGQQALSRAVEQHLAASVEHVVGSHYSGGHWLATFALLALE